MHYRLKNYLILRGWTDIEYALVNTTNGNIEVLNPFQFQVLSLCNGVMDLSEEWIPVLYKELVNSLLENGVIEVCQSGGIISEYQEYKRYSCRYVRTVHWSVTGRCNYRCRHCYMSAPDAKYGEFSLEECLFVIDQMAEAGVFQIMLTGGEPLVRKDFFTIVDALLERNITIKEIYSNGRLITDDLLDKMEIRKIKPAFSISFDGVGWHDWLRGIPGAEKDAIRAFSLLQKRGFKYTVEMSLHKLNAESIDASVKLLAELGVSHLKITPTTDAGSWMKEGGKYTLTIPELYDIYLNYVKVYKDSGAPISLMLGGFFRCIKGSDKYTVPAKKYNGSEAMLTQPLCKSAHETVYVAADGKVLPCIPLSGLPIQEMFPSLLEHRLIDILSDSKYADIIETSLAQLLQHNGKCADCEWKYICGGGCRAGALVTNNDYLGCDEAICHFFKGNYQAEIAMIYNSIY